MQLFTYHYMDETRKSVADSFLENGCIYYRIKMNDGLECIIASFGIPDPENKTIWV